MSESVDLGFPSLKLVPKTDEKQSAKDFKTDQEVRWCPGCGDYAILAGVQSFMPELAALPAGPATDALSMMCDVVVDRSA